MSQSSMWEVVSCHVCGAAAHAPHGMMCLCWCMRTLMRACTSASFLRTMTDLDNEQY